MAYDAKPVVGDTILSTWEERDNLRIRLDLRDGADGNGETIQGWDDDDARQMFEDGFFERRRIGRLSDNDSTLHQSVFEYALEHKIGALATFEARLTAAVDAAADTILETYRTVEAATPAKPDEDPEDLKERLLNLTPRQATNDKSFNGYTQDRLDEIEEYLRDHLEEMLPSQAPAP